MSYEHTSWKKFDVNIDGKRIGGLRGLNYDKTKEKEHLHAAGDEPVAIQSGNVTYSGVLKVLKSEVDAMNDAAKVAGFDDITDVPNLVIVASYKPEGSRLLRTDILSGVEIEKLEKGWDQGAKFMEISLPFKALRLKQA